MYSIRERVRYSETDSGRHLPITGIVNYFQDCSAFQSEDIGVGLDFLKSHKRGWVLSSWQIIVERYPEFGEEIEVSTWATGFEGLYGTRNFVMKDGEGRTAAYANSIWVFMDMQSGRPAKPTEDEISAYQPEAALSMEYAPRKIALPQEWEEKEPFRVMKSQIDTNRHMNNSQYIQMALEVCEDRPGIGQMRVEYKKSAVCGDIIYPKVHREGKMTTVGLFDSGNRLYAAVEFIGEK